jgi:hypothetical protein
MPDLIRHPVFSWITAVPLNPAGFRWNDTLDVFNRRINNKVEKQYMKYQIKDYQKIGKKLKERLELETEIVAVKFVKNISEFQDGFIRPIRDTGKPMTLCMAMANSRYENKKMAMSAEDNS